MEGFDEEIESILYMCREVSVFKIPPLKKNEGHRAQEWGDLGNPLWKGRLRIIERGAGVNLMFEDPNTGKVFAKAPYDPAKPSVEGVLDSSRYFVVRVEDADRKAYIGMGFLERSDSFDFNVALQDYTKRWRARMNPPEAEAEKPSPHLPAGPKKDYSLKDGQTFSISIPGKTKSTQPKGVSDLFGSGSSNSGGGGGGAFPLLPPPPGR
ncbi:adaptin ear-binding coat-associated protein 1 NECAP-1 [Thelephora ganbajun]|uniref:Adaptin ear-binding coat-associated protein 1 NECAP-1 n=1 Tax=Thelephora ganbajun TaxID=370292 RepID=A0ACB6ZTJ9_THEGA|nr:adaptin ear-binding coat-associated protein 1 NECAP-1 [Thelephora ganbajun]